MSKWYKKIAEGIPSSSIFKKSIPEGVWDKCPECKTKIKEDKIVFQLFVCSCGHHFRIGSEEYFSILFDEGKYEELFREIVPKDILHFEGPQPYKERLVSEQAESGLTDAARVGKGRMNGVELILVAMDFSFIGGSMGSAVGERIARAIDYCIQHKIPLVIVSRSVGARMMESFYSLMQMAKTATKLALLGQAAIPFISVLTDPTIGGVTASIGMKGDINIAEPKANIGYAGPKVIKESTGKDLPKGFQRSEFLMEKGFVDMIIERKNLKSTISSLLQLIIEKEPID
ncbi:MAG: acetyl-CoA carboxylase, carboxyltransferase subunit beta [Bacteroidetes bacterium]|nr:acetyl-CoA carboxylase, carboxyltransferase subunit beta [Bacteroidota bacterium]MBL6963278.1 acetyl-CoA carboxylase, carboxyltransferase subunit beta [Bacteroidota bacterium]